MCSIGISQKQCFRLITSANLTFCRNSGQRSLLIFRDRGTNFCFGEAHYYWPFENVDLSKKSYGGLANQHHLNEDLGPC